MRIWFLISLFTIFFLANTTHAIFNLNFSPQRQPPQIHLPFKPTTQSIPSTKPLTTVPTSVPHVAANIDVVPQEAGAGPGTGGSDGPAAMIVFAVVGFVGLGFGFGMGL
ncbi:hypothetical protein BU24DRAFT_461582 [Aaosphaeria arxii CBS 175.79]|uniref:Transmembrane protein n=1 Tax=Aaosphaeria arxii CBS 175.79 TaxID=1450172 RepID=A0A6A5XQ96_9PLEO|nr:uncharacterized protein BU24DRAFT_461582 [Aaosphaeria arxii CBS 175.79]KAF2015332.1 hypothetical protein BU24DRAFT_461582 [Aaosphaeria arxii CBS 175.79]